MLRKLIPVSLVLLFVGFPKVNNSLRAEDSAPPASIFLGGHTLVLGMSKEDVVAGYSSSYDIQQLTTQTGDSLVLRQKQSASQKPHSGQIIGGFDFEGGRLIYVDKRWNLRSGETALAKGVIGLLSELEREQRSVCILDTKSQDDAGIEWKRATLRCGNKTATIFYVNNDGKEEVLLDESISTDR